MRVQIGFMLWEFYVSGVLVLRVVVVRLIVHRMKSFPIDVGISLRFH